MTLVQITLALKSIYPMMLYCSTTAIPPWLKFEQDLHFAHVKTISYFIREQSVRQS